ncbi:hypothetical protein ASD83_14030 [Devosia sp. Root685]|nr:hypothetical protein ASD83_14030 [Devosia sp. Root685]
MLTIEGVMKRDRAHVYGGTRITIGPETASTLKAEELPDSLRERWGDKDIEQVDVEFRVEQPDRQPLQPEVQARARAAHALGVKVLKAPPRVGAFHIHDDGGEFYLSAGAGDELGAWIARVHEVGRAIEARGVGMAQVKALGLNSADAQTAWYKGLQNANDIHQERAVERAFGQWADGDAIASHIAYGLDIFCSADVGKSNASKSVLDPVNRQWLEQTYGVKFMSFEDLLAALP